MKLKWKPILSTIFGALFCAWHVLGCLLLRETWEDVTATAWRCVHFLFIQWSRSFPPGTLQPLLFAVALPWSNGTHGVGAVTSRESLSWNSGESTSMCRENLGVHCCATHLCFLTTDMKERKGFDCACCRREEQQPQYVEAWESLWGPKTLLYFSVLPNLLHRDSKDYWTS